MAMKLYNKTQAEIQGRNPRLAESIDAGLEKRVAEIIDRWHARRMGPVRKAKRKGGRR